MSHPQPPALAPEGETKRGNPLRSPIPPGRSLLRAGSVLALISLVAAAVCVRAWHDRHTEPVASSASGGYAAAAGTDSPELRATLDSGERQFTAGRLDEAAQTFTTAAARAPRDARPLTWLGMIAAKQGQPKQAEAYFARSVQLSPTDADVWRALAELQQRAGEYRAAVASYGQVTHLRPDDVTAWRQLGAVCDRVGLVSAAREALERAAKLSPDDAPTQTRLGQLDLRMERLPEAKKALERAVRLAPTDADAWTELATVSLQLDASPQGLAAAEGDVARAMSVRPSGSAHLALGRILLLRRQYGPAVSELKTALSMDGSLQTAYVYLSQAYAALRQPASAARASAAYESAQRGPHSSGSAGARTQR